MAGRLPEEVGDADAGVRDHVKKVVSICRKKVALSTRAADAFFAGKVNSR